MLKKICALVVLIFSSSLLLFCFTNTTYSQRPQTFSSVVFGPSIRAEDGRTIFNYAEKYGMWSNLRTKTDTIMLETLFLDNRGDFVNPDYAEQIALSDAQIQQLKLIQTNLSFKVNVTTGIALGKFCQIRNPIQMARSAVELEMRLLSRLINKPVEQRVIIDAINVDGPFLRVLAMSRKEFSCNTNEIPMGFNKPDAARIVAFYLSFLKREVERIQGSPVKINLLINLPNWRYDQYMEIAWGEHKNQPIDLREILNLLKDNPSTPLINEVVLDLFVTPI